MGLDMPRRKMDEITGDRPLTPGANTHRNLNIPSYSQKMESLRDKINGRNNGDSPSLGKI
eukprot:snap_masked-scaffold_4-processed-gene-3.44-mRNA-1 protein AED:1.00 eAED:1.00 QI:0/-1/0/0/-1/1/1/0/59